MTTTVRGEAAVADALGRRYWTLTAAERFTLTLEALARGDRADADRLEDTCPKQTYSDNDAEFRDRLQRSYVIALLAMVNLQKHLALIRCSTVFCEQHALYARGPKLLAACAFLYGRQYGMWECGAIEQIDLPDLDAVKAEVKDRPELKQRLNELSGLAEESVLQVAKAVQEIIGMGVGEEALSQWEGFCRFCRRCLGVEGLTLLRAYELGKEDPAAEVLAIFPNAAVDEAKAEERAVHWAGEWTRRFPG
jgi:hypothetical protein